MLLCAPFCCCGVSNKVLHPYLVHATHTAMPEERSQNWTITRSRKGTGGNSGELWGKRQLESRSDSCQIVQERILRVLIWLAGNVGMGKGGRNGRRLQLISQWIYGTRGTNWLRHFWFLPQFAKISTRYPSVFFCSLVFSVRFPVFISIFISFYSIFLVYTCVEKRFRFIQFLCV